MKIKELPQSERPYEKLELYGADMLSNAELLAIIIKTGTKDYSAISIAQQILQLNEKSENDSLRFLQDIPIAEFMKIKGIGKIKAIQLKAICELTKRIARPINNQMIKIKSPKDIVELLMPEMRYEKREIAKLVLLNTKNIIMKIVDISFGGANFAYLEPKEILVEAIKIGAQKMILVHNHPSGDSRPSKNDYDITERIFKASELVGMQLLDHIVIGDGTYQSIMKRG